MGPEELKTLSEGGAWLVLAGVLIWVVKTLIDAADKQHKRHALERQSQEARHRAERDATDKRHRAEREAAEARAERNANKIAETLERALRNRP